MRETTTYQMLADLVLIVHTGIAAFVVGGLVLVIAGNVWRWQWVNGLWFRLAHLAVNGVIVADAWMGRICPLTELEMWLRSKAFEVPYSESFVEHWLQRLIYFDAPQWVFTLAYSIFGLFVLGTWWYFPPVRRRRKPDAAGY
ncbi:MAG: DUF2784 domain-containing protein [Desulfobacteraceae bacterium]|nr:MAG: DUF2784 domain-containing protein [Desulfobacteraceae bacterium]